MTGAQLLVGGDVALHDLLLELFLVLGVAVLVDVGDVIVGLVLAVASWYGFVVGLGIPLTPGVLDGIL